MPTSSRPPEFTPAVALKLGEAGGTPAKTNVAVLEVAEPAEVVNHHRVFSHIGELRISQRQRGAGLADEVGSIPPPLIRQGGRPEAVTEKPAEPPALTT